jgi:hypothetical protein
LHPRGWKNRDELCSVRADEHVGLSELNPFISAVSCEVVAIAHEVIVNLAESAVQSGTGQLCTSPVAFCEAFAVERESGDEKALDGIEVFSRRHMEVALSGWRALLCSQVLAPDETI